MSSSSHLTDIKLTSAFEQFFAPLISGNNSCLAGEIITDCSKWDIFVGELLCRRTNKIIRQIVVNNVLVYSNYRNQGVFKHGMNLLRNFYANEVKAKVVVLDCIRSNIVYQWALQQPHCFISAYAPESVAFYPIDISTESSDLPNMANSVITLDRLCAAEQDERLDHVPTTSLYQWCTDTVQKLAFKAQKQ